jgi:CheY-like chemotaxis protein
MHLPTILIADDDPGIIRLLSSFLRPMGVEIQQATDSVAALVHVHKSPPDLLILDVNMPSGNGLSVCEMLASDARLSQIPVIILTGESGDRMRLRCQALRAQYVQKGPDAMDRIKHMVSQTLSLAHPEPATQLYAG